MDLIKRITSSEVLPEIKIIEFDTFSDLRGKIWTSFIDELTQKLLPDSIYFKHDKFNTNIVTAYLGFDATAKSLHVGSLLQIMILRTLQKCGQ